MLIDAVGFLITPRPTGFLPMQWLRLRPTFQFALRDSRQEAIERLAALYENDRQPDRFLMHGEYGELHLPREEHRLWSPHLSFYVVEPPSSPDSHATGAWLPGRDAPRVEIWTIVWILYLVLAFTAFFGAILAYVQWLLGGSWFGLWLTLGALLAWASIYWIAFIGQQLSADQMRQLGEQLDQLLSQAGLERQEA